MEAMGVNNGLDFQRKVKNVNYISDSRNAEIPEVRKGSVYKGE